MALPDAQTPRGKPTQPPPPTTPRAPLAAAVRIAWKYLTSDTARRRGAAATSVLVVVVVVAMVALLSATLSQTPLVFMRFAETDVGEIDVLLTAAPERLTLSDSLRTPDVRIPSDPSPGRLNLPFLEFERLLEAFDDPQNAQLVQNSQGMAPRWLWFGTVRDRTRLRSTRVAALVYDDTRERTAQIGRTWDRRGLGELEAYISERVVDEVGVVPDTGQRGLFELDIVELLETIGINPANLQNSTSLVDTFGLPEQFVLQLPEQTIPSILPETLELLGFPADRSVNISIPLSSPDENDQPETTWLYVDPVALSFTVPITLFDLTPNLDLSDLRVSTEFTARDSINDPDGKWPDRLGNVFALEARFVDVAITNFVKNFFDTLSFGESVPLLLQEPIRAALRQSVLESLPYYSPYDAASSVVIQYKDRIPAYMADSTTSTRLFARFTDQIAEITGVDYNAALTLPIKSLLDGSNILKIFLEQVFFVIFLVIVVLGGILIYTLSLSEVDERTYEFGMLRALGLRQKDLMLILFMRGARAAVPGTMLGLGLALAMYGIVARFIGSVADVGVPISFPALTLILVFVVGFGVPFVANVVPTRKALSVSLKDSIDIGRDKTKVERLVITRSEDLGIDAWEIAIAIVLLISGTLFYFVLPESFLSNNFSLLFGIMNWALLGMLIGLTVTFQTIQPLCERLLLKVVIPPVPWAGDFRLQSIVRRNLDTHLRRNRFAAIMIALSTGFVIFSGVLIKQQVKGIEIGLIDFYGSDVVVSSVDSSIRIVEEDVTGLLKEQTQQGLVEAYTFLSAEEEVDAVSSIAGAPSTETDIDIFGVDESFFDSLAKGKALVTEIAPVSSGDWDLKSLLDESSGAVPREWPTVGTRYGQGLPNMRSTRADEELNLLDIPGFGGGPMHILISEGMRPAFSFDTSTPLVLELPGAKIRARATIMALKLPGFPFSAYEFSATTSPIIMSAQNFQVLQQLQANVSKFRSDVVSNARASWKPLPKSRLLIRISDDPPGRSRAEAMEVVVNSVRTELNDSYNVFDIDSGLRSTQKVSDGLNAFALVVAVVSDILCSIMLVMAFRGNAKENTWEIAVLRSSGVTNAQLQRIFLYESLCVVGASTTLGTVVGLLLAATLNLQFGVLTETQFEILFPWGTYLVLVGLIFSLAVLIPRLTMSTILRRPIASVLRSTDD